MGIMFRPTHTPLVFQSSILFLNVRGLLFYPTLVSVLSSTLLCLTNLVISFDIELRDPVDNISQITWSPLMSFPYFDVIPTVELRVCAKKRSTF